MSYILDALKRSEQERRRAETPSAEAPAVTAAPARRSWLGPVVAAVVAVNLGALAWHFWPRPAAAPAQVTAAPLAPAPSLATAAGSDRQREVATLAAPPEPAPAPEPAPRAEPAPVAAAPSPAPAVTLKPAPRPAVTISPTPLTVASAGVPRLTDLPASFQQGLPPLNVNIHVYTAQPAGRFVLVDMHRYKEGSDLPGGVRLEEITATGLVLSYQGQRFLKVVR